MASVSKKDGKPLAGAGARNRGKAGRPRKRIPSQKVGNASARSRANTAPDVEAPASKADGHTFLPRLLDLEGAAQYLSLSTWTLRRFIDEGIVSRVMIPMKTTSTPQPRVGSHYRKILLDRLDLDHLIKRLKDGKGKG